MDNAIVKPMLELANLIFATRLNPADAMRIVKHSSIRSMLFGFCNTAQSGRFKLPGLPQL
jgi:hypothetical protein